MNIRFITALLFVTYVFVAKGEELKTFPKAEQLEYEKSCLEPIVAQVMKANLPYPKINNRVKDQTAMISKNFPNKRIQVVFYGGYHATSSRVVASSGVDDQGRPQIVIYNQAIMNIYGCNYPSIVRTLMHERDHLTEMRSNLTKIDLSAEIHFQALTTEYVTYPMKNMYAVDLSPNDTAHYNAWINGGRSEKSRVWIDHIKTMLNPVLK